jgi:hypothetical protein
MKKIVLVGLAASIPALAAEPATVPEIRRAAGGAPAATTRNEIKDAGTVKLRTPGAEIKLKEYKLKEEHKAGAYGELKSPGAAEYKAPAARELKAPAEHKEIKDAGAFKFRGDAATPETPPMQREAPVRY